MKTKGELHILLVKVFRTHYRRAHTSLGKEGITQGQPRILDWLWEHDGCIQREIASQCNLEPATVTSILTNMEKAGLITRQPDSSDRRVMNVWLTEKGRTVRGNMRNIFSRLEEECFEGFSVKEKEEAEAYLLRMYANMRRAEENQGEKE